VQVDPRVEEITALLPGMNCGSCGWPGCSEYAKAIVHESADLTLCGPGGAETSAKLARAMGAAVAARERTVAIVLCQGDDVRARRIADYNGVADCASADLTGAGKACRWGCLGLGTCARVCPANAIEMTPERLAVVRPELCISCGKCVSACPRRLIRMVPESRTIHILCVSRDRGPVVRKACDVGCIGCGRCAKIANSPAIRMEGALAVVNYEVPSATDEVIEKCPMGTIVKRSGRRREVAASA